MSRISYESTETLVFDPVSANRAATRASLYNLGFRHIETAATLEAFEDAIKRSPPDLALCEAQGGDEDLCRVIQSLRQGITGYNPFIVIIVTAWENNTQLVRRVVNSGADDLLLRPFSTAVLGARIKTHVERRKGFVITSEYVGPDRRKDTSRDSGVELFVPPNSLKMKAHDRLSADEVAIRLEAELREAKNKLNSEKLRRDAFQICVLWRLMQASIPGTGKFDVDLTKLQEVTKSVARRCLGTEFEPAIDWCQSILAALEGLSAGVDRNASMHLLGHAALNLHQVFAPERTAAEHLAEIDATVTLVRARTETAMAS
ncbi:MAG: response regulator [Alphaproteobacteria bacterium]|nr:response regulator [Alphaproteobacteria bacterium]